MDYNKLALTSKRLIDKNGRNITLTKLGAGIADPDKPWRGTQVVTETDPVITKGVFAIGNTSIPTESRGLAFDWVDSELLKVTRHVCIVAAEGLPVLDEYKVMHEEGQTKPWNIIWGQCLQPGTKRILYVFGLKE